MINRDAAVLSGKSPDEMPVEERPGRRAMDEEQDFSLTFIDEMHAAGRELDVAVLERVRRSVYPGAWWLLHLFLLQTKRTAAAAILVWTKKLPLKDILRITSRFHQKNFFAFF